MNGPLFKKVCLLGDFAVGKTSLVRRFVDNQFNDEYLSTIGVKISRKLVKLSEISNLEMHVVLWDLEGRDEYVNLLHSYLGGASGAVVVCDAARPTTISNIPKHISAFLNVNPAAPIVLAYNKMDLIPSERLQEFPRTNENNLIATSAFTSAKEGSGVADLFVSLCKLMVK